MCDFFKYFLDVHLLRKELFLHRIAGIKPLKKRFKNTEKAPPVEKLFNCNNLRVAPVASKLSDFPNDVASCCFFERRTIPTHKPKSSSVIFFDLLQPMTHLSSVVKTHDCHSCNSFIGDVGADVILIFCQEMTSMISFNLELKYFFFPVKGVLSYKTDGKHFGYSVLCEDAF